MADSVKTSAFNDYIGAVQSTLAGGYASEGSHYPTLKTLLESLADGITATSLPSRIACGAPDFIVTEGSATVGYVEAKDIGRSLDEAEKTEQLRRYLLSLSNLILTDYLEFRWYVDGECRLKAGLGSLTKDGKIKRDRDGIQAVAELLTYFLAHRAEGVGTPRDLARRMARQAHLIRNLIIKAFLSEPEGGNLHTQLAAFRDNLIPDLSAECFADMYAQTIAYGLFAARCTSKSGASFTRLDAAQNLPRTNPFLRRLFQYIAGYELDDRIAWLVDDLAHVLAQADMEAVLKDFGKRIGKEDPVVHFYETFLKEYDEKIREMRGVYYTPEPVVSYIVRSIGHLLKTRFNKPLGLGDPDVYVLDPATGTATFLYMVINEIRQSFAGQEGMWKDYVAGRLLQRIFGFELLMAPYAVAHLKLGLLLQETGYEVQSDQRLGIYLTNTLEEATKRADTLFDRWITDESNAAAEIKKEKPIMVVLGNPPYSAASSNKGRWITQLIKDYKRLDNQPLKEKNLKALQDDYVKFIRFGQWRIDRTGRGILALITNHTYLDNFVFSGMRQSLIHTFDDIYIVDLHGNVRKKELCPDGGKDDNVFDIKQGVAIAIFVKSGTDDASARVHHAEIWGDRETKYERLRETDISNMAWIPSRPCSPLYSFVPPTEEPRSEYQEYWRVTDIFPLSSDAVKTHRDHFVVAFDEPTLTDRIASFRSTNTSDDDICHRFGLANTEACLVADARQSLRDDVAWTSRFTRYLYRPFDIRCIFYHRSLVDRPRTAVMHHMLGGQNRAICVGRAGQVVGPVTWDLLFCSDTLDDCNLFYRGGTVNLPLYIYPLEGELQFEAARRPNLDSRFIKTVSVKLGLTFVEDRRGDLEHTFGPEDIFNYVYAVFHSPTYRARYAESLKIDFPRLPLTSDKGLFESLVEKGAELVSLHLMQSPVLNDFITRYPISGSDTVDRVSYDSDSQRVHVNRTQYFQGVPPDAWSFHIGGYHVAHKWLKDRKGRTLNYDELTHYQRVIVALKETIRLMAEIDELIPGWPLE